MTYIGESSGHRQRGQSLVEVTLLLPLLSLLMLGALDLGRAYYAYSAVANAARVGAQYAAYSTVWSTDEATVEQKVRDEARDIAITDVSLTPAGQEVAVEVTYDFPLLTPGASRIWGNPVTMSYTATARYE